MRERDLTITHGISSEIPPEQLKARAKALEEMRDIICNVDASSVDDFVFTIWKNNETREQDEEALGSMGMFHSGQNQALVGALLQSIENVMDMAEGPEFALLGMACEGFMESIRQKAKQRVLKNIPEEIRELLQLQKGNDDENSEN